MVREIPQLSPETMQEMERQHQALLAAYAEKKERLMQGDMTVLEDAFSRLLTERERKIIEMTYGIGMPKMTVGQIAESPPPKCSSGGAIFVKIRFVRTRASQGV